jgi:hypothetical protein
MAISTRQGVIASFVIIFVEDLIVFVLSLVNAVWFGSNAPLWGGFGHYMCSLMDGYNRFIGSYGALPTFLPQSPL